jgi:Zn-dependent protease with chaperone function
LLERLTRPSPAYKRSARLAVAGLLGFVLLYFAMAGWFLWTAYRLVLVLQHSSSDGFWTGVGALCAAFFGLFMLKAVLSIRKPLPEGLTEVTAKEQPKLFSFLYDLADQAGAPRPHRVFLSNRVNAAVFYDVSLLNLIFPSRKNLEIGLPLVNVLPLGELRAVLAHEFGHFAQRSMAVGRWAYVAQQVATHLVSHRDKFDGFLDGLGRIDIRLRVFAWLLQLVVWAIRSLVESAFRLVIAMQSALSREMEMQADLVAVSLTGSDALVHALHRLHAADDAWGRAMSFVRGEAAEKRATRDAFAVQSHITQRMAAILDDPTYGGVPALPAEQPELHRVFKASLAQPPKMWQTHPLNHEREANAKRVYVPVAIEQTSAWSLFDEPAALRQRMTAQLLEGRAADAPPLVDTDLETSLRTLGEQYRREQYHRRYCGIYFGRALTRHAGKASELVAPQAAADGDAAQFYPPSLRADVAQLRALADERDQLHALVAGYAEFQGRSIHVRGVEYRRKDLPAALAQVKEEMAAVEARLRAHDVRCRSWHVATAARLGGGWDAYLTGLLALLHYCEHTEANLSDAYGLLLNAAGVETATRRVSDQGIARILSAANALHLLLELLYQQSAGGVVLDEQLVARMELQGNWKDMLGEFHLPAAQRENINDWMGAIGGWVAHACGTLSAVRSAALEQLLLTEIQVARQAHQGVTPETAPEPSRVPNRYEVLLWGGERERQTQLGLWARFLRAEGFAPAAARLAAAGGIVALVLGAGMQQGDATLTIYNGLGTAVRVLADGRETMVAPQATARLPVAPQDSHTVAAYSAAGSLIEQFDASDGGGAPVYNVAGAAPLVEWTASYGSAGKVPERRLGAPRWLGSRADFLFAKPPEKVSSRSGNTRTVLEGLAALSPQEQMQLLTSDEERYRVILLHARWDDMRRPDTAEWLAFAVAAPGTSKAGAELLARRVQAAPDDVVLLRMEQDAAGGARPEVCARHIARAKAAPGNADLAYLALRCAPDGPQNDAAFRQAAQRWPNNAWLRNAVGWDLLRNGDFAAAEPHVDFARKQLPAVAAEQSLMLARIQRWQRGWMDFAGLSPASPRLRQLSALEDGYGDTNAPTRAYAHLNKGALAAALALTDDVPEKARVLRLVAASDGASPDTIKRALALPPDQGMDEATIWVTVALAMRQGAPAAPYLEAARNRFGAEQPRISAFLDAVRAGKGQGAEALLQGAHPEARMLAYSAALVLAGEKAPAAWRLAGKRMLFASERPYFR